MMTKEEMAEFHTDQVSEKIAQEAYDKVMEGLNSRYSKTQRQMGNSLLPDLLLEKAYDLEELRKTENQCPSEKELIRLSDRVIRKGKDFKNSKLKAEDLFGVSEGAIQDKISQLMELALDAGQVDKKAIEEQNQILKSMKGYRRRRLAHVHRKRM